MPFDLVYEVVYVQSNYFRWHRVITGLLLRPNGFRKDLSALLTVIFWPVIQCIGMRTATVLLRCIHQLLCYMGTPLWYHTVNSLLLNCIYLMGHICTFVVLMIFTDPRRYWPIPEDCICSDGLTLWYRDIIVQWLSHALNNSAFASVTSDIKLAYQHSFRKFKIWK